jgi:CBS domain-containing protein
VRDIMSTDMTTVSPDTDLYALAHLFVQKRVRRLPVVDGRELLGQVSRRDVLRRVLR